MSKINLSSLKKSLL